MLRAGMTKRLENQSVFFLNKQKEVVRRVFLLKYFYFESNIAIAERCGFTERKVTHMLAHTGAQLKEYLIKEEIYL